MVWDRYREGAPSIHCEIRGGDTSELRIGVLPGPLAFAQRPLRRHQTFHSRTSLPPEAIPLVERRVDRFVEMASRSTLEDVAARRVCRRLRSGMARDYLIAGLGMLALFDPGSIAVLVTAERERNGQPSRPSAGQLCSENGAPAAGPEQILRLPHDRVCASVSEIDEANLDRRSWLHCSTSLACNIGFGSWSCKNALAEGCTVYGATGVRQRA